MIHSKSGAHLCNLLLVIHNQQWHGQQDGSKSLNSILKTPSRGQLVTLLKAGNEVREAQSHSRKSLLCPTVLK